MPKRRKSPQDCHKCTQCDAARYKGARCHKHWVQYRRTHARRLTAEAGRDGAHVLTIKRNVDRCLYCDLTADDCLKFECKYDAAKIYTLRIQPTRDQSYELRDKLGWAVI